MILRCDIDASTRQITNRMIRAVMANGESACGCPRGATDDLMTETDAEKWCAILDQRAR
jgi:hypothetical protein